MSWTLLREVVRSQCTPTCLAFALCMKIECPPIAPKPRAHQTCKRVYMLNCSQWQGTVLGDPDMLCAAVWRTGTWLPAPA